MKVGRTYIPIKSLYHQPFPPFIYLAPYTVQQSGFNKLAHHCLRIYTMITLKTEPFFLSRIGKILIHSIHIIILTLVFVTSNIYKLSFLSSQFPPLPLIPY